MNQVLSLVEAARTSSDPGAGLSSAALLAELLTLHEEMIGQLCLERLESVGSADFLTAMIEQHEKTAAMLRAKLARQQPGNFLERHKPLRSVAPRLLTAAQ